MTSKTRKLSRREREEQQQMRRMMIFGGGAVALMGAAGIGVSMLPPSFPMLEGEGDLDARLERGGLTEHVLPLNPDAARTDIVVIGTTDCSFCRQFVEDGREELAQIAKTQNLGITYAPTGSSASSLASTRLLSCLARHGAAEPVEILRLVYAAAEEFRGGDIEAVAMDYGQRAGASPADIKACLAESPLEITRRIQALGRELPIRATPMFFVASEKDPARIHTFSGWAGAGGMRRQIENARKA